MMKTQLFLFLCLTICSCSQSDSHREEQVSIIEIQQELANTLASIVEEQSTRNPLNDIQLVDIDCSKTDSLLSDAYEADQNLRKGMQTEIVDVDAKNQQTIVSILEQCGWPNSRTGIDAVWIVLQHSNTKLISNYYPSLKRLEKEGRIKSGAMALMEDRLLMFNGHPQIYGSQVVGDKLYDLKYPDRVNALRTSVGLEAIEDYTKRFGFDFNIEDYRN